MRAVKIVKKKSGMSGNFERLKSGNPVLSALIFVDFVFARVYFVEFYRAVRVMDILHWAPFTANYLMHSMCSKETCS